MPQPAMAFQHQQCQHDVTSLSSAGQQNEMLSKQMSVSKQTLPCQSLHMRMDGNVQALTAVIERSKETTMMGIERELKDAAASLERCLHRHCPCRLILQL